MTPKTAKALALITSAPHTVGTANTYYTADNQPREVRAIVGKSGTNLLELVWTTTTVDTGECDDCNHHQRRVDSNALVSGWAKMPELIAALDGAIDLLEGLRLAGYFNIGGTPIPLAYGRRILDETLSAITAANETATPAA